MKASAARIATARIVTALVVTSLLAAASCGTVERKAAGRFQPATPGVLTVATSYPAPGFWEGTADRPDGGFEHGIAEALQDRFDVDELRIVDVPFEALVSGDLQGADLALAQITPTPERDAVLDFTSTYLGANPAVILRPGGSVSDLAAARELVWAVQRATTQAELIDSVIHPSAAVVIVDDPVAVVDAVIAGTADAGLLDLPTALVEEQRTDGAVVVVAQFATGDGLAIAVPEGSSNLEALDSAVRSLSRNGTLSDLADQWLGRSIEGDGLAIPIIRSRSQG